MSEEENQWAKVFDPGSKAYYYYNVVTYETSWDRPANFKDEDEGALSVGDGLKMLKATKMIQRNYRAKVARGELRKRRSMKQLAAHPNESGCDWVATLDPHSQQNYYYHTTTFETVWDPPQEWIDWDRKQNPDKYKALDKEKKRAEKRAKAEKQAKLDAFKAKRAGGGNQLAGLGGLGAGGFGGGSRSPQGNAVMGGVQAGLASAVKRRKKGDDEDGDEKTPFMMGRRAQAEIAAREAAKKAEAAAAKYDQVTSKMLDFMVEKCSKCNCGKWWCKPCAFPWAYEGRPIKSRNNPGAETMDDSFDLVGFYKEADICVCSFFMPCIQYGCNERYIDERNDMGFLCCLCYACSCVIPVCGPMLMLTWQRAKFRELVGLPKEPWVVDYCASCCCHFCTLSQIGRGIRNVGYDGTTDFIGAPDTMEMTR